MGQLHLSNASDPHLLSPAAHPVPVRLSQESYALPVISTKNLENFKPGIAGLDR